MNTQRRIRRAQERIAQLHFSVLGELLMKFYEFLEGTPKPSDEEVRQTFIDYEQRWKKYCATHKLTDDASLLFNKEIGESWRSRYTQQSELTAK